MLCRLLSEQHASLCKDMPVYHIIQLCYHESIMSHELQFTRSLIMVTICVLFLWTCQMILMKCGLKVLYLNQKGKG